VVLLSHFSSKICGISLAIFTCYPGTANAENIANRNIFNYSQKLQPALNIKANKIDFREIFKQLGVEGSIVIYDQSNNKFYEHNPPRNSKAFFPASTFKILNTLVALETGVIRDDITVLTWDGIKRKFAGVEVGAWNQDTNLRQAFKDSTIWFYQVIARKAGRERMQNFINQAGYGNRQIGTAEEIDKFWLEGPLQITPKQQIEFLQKLYSRKLPFSSRSFNLLKDIMIVEQTPNYTLRGKTGWVDELNPNIGWFVGYLEQNNKVYFFATNIDMPSPKLAKSRIEVTRRCLQMLGLLEAAKN
jgi:beta-lactamase class D